MTDGLIWISRKINGMLGGGSNEMFCSRAWRLRDSFLWWVTAGFIDYCTPLGLWHYDGMTHCQSCYVAERHRGRV